MATEYKTYDGNFYNSQFCTRYQRNNKKYSLKNLRCFPSCSSVHKEKGFCGTPVKFKVNTNDSSSSIFCFAEFLSFEDKIPSGCTTETCQPLQIKIGSKLSLSSAISRCRTKKNPGNPWLIGTEETKDSLIFNFNKAKRGWHYGWQSNKHTCDTLHCFRVYIFSRQVNIRTGESSSSSSNLICQNIFDSSKFMLFCRRRRRYKAR